MAEAAEVLAELFLQVQLQESRDQNAPAVERYAAKHIGKSMEESTRLREQGNSAYKRRDLLEAVLKYTRSIATAPCDGNTTGLALAFANRSSVHFLLGYYEDCLSDIEQALKVNYPSRLIYKVLKRRAECHQVMGNMDAARKSMEEAISCCLEEDKKRSMEQELAALKSPEQVYKPRLRVRPPPEKYLGDNPMIPGASACIEIKYNEKYGRHLVATQDIPPGAVLIVEESFGSVLIPDKCVEYCFRCLNPCSSMIPCKSCTIAMYCSETCRESSWTESHDLECAALMKLIASDEPKQSLVGLRLFIVALKKHGNLQQLCDYVRHLDTEVIDGIKGCDAEGRFDPTDLRAVFNLTQLKFTIAEIVENTKRCAFVVECIDKTSQLFQGREDLKIFARGFLNRFTRIMAVNAFSVQNWDEENDEIGSAIYPISSLINHRCIANAVQYQSGNTMVNFAQLPIDKGEQVFISYHGEHDMAGVQETIFSLYGVHCDCRGCTNPLPEWTALPLCPKCRTVVDSTPKKTVVKCLQCNKRYNARDLTSAANLMMHRINQIIMQPLNPDHIPEICEIITKLHRTVLLSNKMQFGVCLLLHRTLTKGGHYVSKPMKNK